MATRKVQDDPMAREMAGDVISQAINRAPITEGALSVEDDREAVAAMVLDAFPYVETETATAKLPGGETMTMTRLVLTSGWTPAE